MTRKHIVIAPFVGMGCILPAVELARKLAAVHRVTVILCDMVKSFGIQQKVLDMNRNDAMENITLKFTTPIDMAPLNAGSSDTSVQSQHLSFIEMVTRGCAEITSCLEGLLKEDPMDAVIVELLWGGELVDYANSKCVPAYYFCSGSSMELFLIGAITTDTRPDDPVNGAVFADLPSEGQTILESMFYRLRDPYLSAQQGLPFVRGIIINSVRELDVKATTMLKKYPAFDNLKLWFLGPLLPVTHESREDSDTSLGAEVRAWLDRKPARSVVYASFGSHCMPRPSQLKEIIAALKSLKNSVIFSLHRLCFKDLPDDVKPTEVGKINDGSNDRLLVLPWTPQTVILAHPAVAVFLSHCGWNSTMEAITYGVPVVAWPYISDQKRNGELLADIGMAVILPDVSSHENSRVVSADEIVNSVNEVGAWTGNTRYGEAATKWKEVVATARRPGGSSFEELQDFLSQV